MAKKSIEYRVNDLHQRASVMWPELERIIDELKRIEPRDQLNALPNIKTWLGQLSDRAHVQGSPYRYVLVAPK